MKKTMYLAVFLAMMMVGGTAFGIPQDYDDRDQFNLAIGGILHFQSFENDFTPASSIVFSGFTVSLNEGVLAQIRNFPGLVEGAITDGTGALGYDDTGVRIATFSFNTLTTAFGLDIATNPGSTMTINVGSENFDVILGDDFPSFWGVIDSAGFNSITFSAGGNPYVGFDAVSFGKADPSNPIPEPATMLLFGFGLIGMAGFRRKRQKF